MPLQGTSLAQGPLYDTSRSSTQAKLVTKFEPLAQVSCLHGVSTIDSKWTPPANGAGVALWPNRGTVGGDPVQAVPGSQPLYRAAGFPNGMPSVEFDRVDDYLDTVITGIPQPYSLMAVVKYNATTPANQVYFARGGTSATHGLYNDGTPKFSANFNAGLASTVTVDTGTHAVWVWLNGSFSFIMVDGIVVNGFAGAGGLSRFLLGAGSDSTPTFGQFFGGHLGFAAVYGPTTSHLDLTGLHTDLRSAFGAP